jgi:CRISPR-associated endonuclease/helicase Cas3
MTDYLQFWGKAGGERIGEPAWHPNAYHSLDVAASAEALLLASPRKLAMLARLLGTSPDNALRLIVCLIALHDVGKFASNFQKKVPEFWPSAVLGGIAKDLNNQSVRHDQTGFELRGKLKFETLATPAFSQWTCPGPDIARLWGAIAGHHGKPVPNGGSTDIVTGMSTSGINAACAFARDTAALFCPFKVLPERETEQLVTASWVIAGLTNIADWVGSNRDRFRYCEPNVTLADY